MLAAIPKTPLYDRLHAEGRLHTSDDTLWFVPKRMSAAALRSTMAARTARKETGQIRIQLDPAELI